MPCATPKASVSITDYQVVVKPDEKTDQTETRLLLAAIQHEIQ